MPLLVPHRPRPDRLYRRRLFRTLSAVVAFALALIGSVALVISTPTDAQADPPNGCSYAATGSGTYADTICWLDMTSYSFATSSSAAGQPMSSYLGFGYTASYTIRTVREAGTQTIVPTALPTYSAAYLGRAGYTGITGRPALYQNASQTSTRMTLTLSDIVVRDGAGNPVTGYAVIGADAEDTSGVAASTNQESITWTSNQILRSISPVSPANNACSGGFSGDGTNSIQCIGATYNAKTGTPIVASTGATTFSQLLTTPAQTAGRQGVAFGFQFSKVNITKQVASRLAGDEFTVSTTLANGTTLGTASTAGGATSATTTSLGLIGGPDGENVTFAEAAAPGSPTDLANYGKTWTCTNRGAAWAATPTTGVTSFVGNVVAGDVIDCVITNRSATLTLVKNVNANGTGNTTPASAWTLSATGPTTGLSGTSGSAAVTNAPGAVGSYALAETGPTSGWTASQWSCVTGTGAAVTGNNVTLVAGQNSTCTITNTRIPSVNVSLAKSWQSATAGDAVTLTVANTTQSTTNSAGTAVAPDNGSASTLQAFVGEQITISEAYTAGTDRYRESATCNNGVGAVTLTAGSGSFQVPAGLAEGTTIACVITNTGPVVPDLTSSGEQGQPVTQTPTLAPGMDPTTVQLIGPDGNPTDGPLVVPGEGTWTVDPATGAITFTPDDGFQGSPTPISYVASDVEGNVSPPGTVTVTYPDVSPVTNSGAQGDPVTVPPALGAGTDPTTVQFPTAGQPTGSTVSADGKTLTVPGQGEWTIDPTTGAMTFTPEPNFQGDPTPVLYTAADADGNLAEPATVTVTYPDVSPVANSGAQGQPVTVPPIMEEGTLPETVQFPTAGQPTGSTVSADGKTLTVPGQGEWKVDPITGAMTFTPEAGFQGNPTPVLYTAADANGNLAEPATVTVTYPDVSPIVETGTQGQPVTVPPVLGEGTDPTTVQFPAAGQPDGSTVSPDGKTLTVPGQGEWTIDPTTGAMTFTPEAGFQGDPTPVLYTAADADGNLAEPATVTITYPDVSPVSGVGQAGQPVTLQPALEPGTLPGTVQFPSAGQPDGSTVSPDGKTLTVPGQGEWTIDPTTGAMTFTPEPNFRGNPTPVLYTAADADGNLAIPATATVTYTVVDPVAQKGTQGQPVTVPPALGEGMDPTTVVFPAEGQPEGSSLSPDGKTLTVPGQGEWKVDPTTGAMTFTPEAGFTGDPTPVLYTAADADGNLATPATVTVTYPDVDPVSSSGAQGQPVTVPPALEPGTLPETVQFPTAGQPTGSTVSPDGKTLTVPGQGEWTINPTTGAMTFTPEPNFQGDPTPVLYTAADADGNLAIPATVTITYPDVSPVSNSGRQGQPVTVPPALDEGTLPSTVQFPSAGQPAGAVVAPDGKSMTVPGQGVWTIDPTTGAMTFTPEAGFTGDPTPVLYTAADADGNLAIPATVTVTYPDVAPVTKSGTQGQPVTVPPALGEGTLPSTVQFPTAGQPDGSTVSPDGKTLTVPGQGVWTIDPTTGAMTFTPEAGFTGDPTPVLYTAADANGNVADPATATVTYPDVSPVSGNGDQGQPVTINPSLEEGTLPETVRFPSAGQPAGSTVSPDGKTLTVPGEGVWTINPTTGAMTFTPETGFQGSPTSVLYTATDADGNLAIPAPVTITYPDVADLTGGGDQGKPVTIAPKLDGGALPETVTFPSAGQPAGSTISPDGKTLTVPGQGVWTIDPTTGAITFTPEEGFQGDPTPVLYTAQDADGNATIPATVTITYPDVLELQVVKGVAGQPVTVFPDLPDGMDPSTVMLVDSNGNRVSTLTVPGEGVWTVNPDGSITFTPEEGFTGNPTPVLYTAQDANGNWALPASLAVEYELAAPVPGEPAPPASPTPVAPVPPVKNPPVVTIDTGSPDAPQRNLGLLLVGGLMVLAAGGGLVLLGRRRNN